ncbi:hypothetical protein BG004_003749 [Podila humilis]|nr:hypothetical protein BG004_003749 [Podila humilis]
MVNTTSINTTSVTSKDGKILYPTVRRASVTDTLHGVSIHDPYRWLEDPDSKETEAFVDAQNEISCEYMSKFSGRDQFNERLTSLYNHEKFTAPYKRGAHYYFSRNSGLQAQDVLYQQDSLDSEPRVFLDPNTLESDGTAALGVNRFSKSGELFCYGISKSGSDWVTLHLQDHNGNKLEDIIEWAKFTDISFTHDDKGFFYSGYEKPEVEDSKAGTETNTNINKRVIGTPQEEDVVVYLDTANPIHSPSVEVSDDGKHIVMSINQGCDRANKLYIIDFQAHNYTVSNTMKVDKIVDDFGAQYEYLTNDGSVFYFRSNLDAPRYKVVQYDLLNRDKVFVDLVPQADGVLGRVNVLNKNKLVVAYMHDVKDCLYIHDLATGKFLQQINVPIGTISGMTGHRGDNELFFAFSSFLSPGTLFRYDFLIEDETKRLSIFRKANVKNFNESLFETKQVFYESKDGTKVSMFIIHKRGLVLDGHHPGFLYGYGGFGIPIQPSFIPAEIIFMQHMGGVVAYPALRGGGEYGEEWHESGMLLKKQNTFDDFQYAAKYLIKEGYTNPGQLAINGGSNGGLLVAACVNQAPELFGAAVCHVGVLDMLRFHKFTIGHSWQSDYGYPDENEEHFHYLHKYSPLHNINIKRPYPPVAIFTSSHDDRVVPLHSFKYIAELQHTAGPLTEHPLVIRVETKAGHGAGKPIAKRIAETTDEFSFMGQAIGAVWSE